MKKLSLMIAVLLITNIALMGQVNLDSLLVGYWPFHGNANDETGNADDGIVHGAVLTSDRFGHENSAYLFDGSDDYIDCGNNSSLSISKSISICAWIKSDYVNNYVATKWKTESGWEGSWRFYSNQFAVTHNGWDHYGIHANDTIDHDDFNLIVGIYDYDIDSMKFYLNGLLSNQIAGVGGTMYVSNARLFIGGSIWYANGWHESYFNGVIDDIRIYSRAITPEEIDSLYSDRNVSSIDDIHNQGSSLIKLKQNYPNPFTSETTIEYFIQDKDYILIQIFDLKGQLVKTLVDGIQSEGNHVISWKGDNDLNIGVSPGIYYYILNTGQRTVSKKMMLIE
jgi:hypothetical protein